MERFLRTFPIVLSVVGQVRLSDPRRGTALIKRPLSLGPPLFLSVVVIRPLVRTTTVPTATSMSFPQVLLPVR